MPPEIGTKCGQTFGCLGVPSTSWNYIMKNIRGEEKKGGDVIGPLLYTFGPKQKLKSDDYCGGDNLWK